jgi:hypothetical protein
VTPEQEALRDRIADVRVDYGDPAGAERVGQKAATTIIGRMRGLRVVGDDEVVVKRSSIREGWLWPDGRMTFTRPDGPHIAMRVGVTPWPPEETNKDA